MFKKTFFRRLPIETWIIGIPSIAIFVFTFCAHWRTHITTSLFMREVILSLVGERFLRLGLSCLYLYIMMRLVYRLSRTIERKESLTVLRTEILQTLRSALYWIIIIALGTLASSIGLSFVFQASTLAHIAHASHTLLFLDTTLYGTYPNNALNVFLSSHSTLAHVVLYSYALLSYIVPVTLVILACTNTQKFRQFLLSFFITTFIGLVFWTLIPATSPRGYIDANITHTSTSSLAMYKATPAPETIPYFIKTDTLWIDPTEQSFNVSTFPSMHATWATLIVISIAIVIPYLSIITIPWCIALMLGAVTIYQHFTVDIFAGIMLALITFFVSGKLLNFEKTYYDDRYSYMHIWRITKNDAGRIIAWIQKITTF